MHLPALRSKNYQIYLAGSFFSLNGAWISRIIIGWLSWDLTGSASWVGIMSFCLFAPVIVSSPLFGVLMDRIDLRRAVMTTQWILAAAILSLFILYASEALTIWSLGFITLVVGFTNSADRTIRMSLVPLSVDKDSLPNAVALYATIFNTARLIGPAIGGMTIATLGTGAAILMNLAMTLPILLALRFLVLRERQFSDAKREPFFVELVDGARHAAARPIIREGMILTGLSSCAVRGVMEILPVIADGVFQRGAQGLGHMVAAGGGGALVASVAIAMRRTDSSDLQIPLHAHITVYIGFFAVMMLGLIDSWIAALAVTSVVGFSGTMVGISMQSAIHLQLDDVYRSRVMSLWMIMGIGGSATGAIVLGSLTDLFGLSVTLVGTGLVGAILSAAFKFSVARIPSSHPHK
jgi:MFS family permease